MLKGRFNHQLVAANGLIYAVGGEGPLFEHDDIEVRGEVALSLYEMLRCIISF